MTQQQKDDGDDFLSTIKGAGKKAFDKASEGISYTVDDALRRVHTVKEMASDGLEIVESAVGKERFWGAIAGAKIGAGFAATKPNPLYVHGIVVAGAAGGALGFLFGPLVYDRDNKANDKSNDNKDTSSPEKPATKPNDPMP